MGGSAANDDLEQGYQSQVWLAASNDTQARKSGNYYYHGCLSRYDERVDNQLMQQQLMHKLATLATVEL